MEERRRGAPRLLPPGCLSLIVLVAFVILLPIFLADAMLTALGRLGFTPRTSLFLAVGVLLGGVVNVPIRRFTREEFVDRTPVGLFGLDAFLPRRLRRRSFIVLAVNLGGCVLPTGMALYQLARIAGDGLTPLAIAVGAVGVVTLACYWVARPVPQVGVLLPPIVPAALAALCATLFGGDLAAPTAFSAGVLGPLIGADLFHIREVLRVTTGVASIGGAGTFDGIVISGLVATLLS